MIDSDEQLFVRLRLILQPLKCYTDYFYFIPLSIALLRVVYYYYTVHYLMQVEVRKSHCGLTCFNFVKISLQGGYQAQTVQFTIYVKKKIF